MLDYSEAKHLIPKQRFDKKPLCATPTFMIKQLFGMLLLKCLLTTTITTTGMLICICLVSSHHQGSEASIELQINFV